MVMTSVTFRSAPAARARALANASWEANKQAGEDEANSHGDTVHCDRSLNKVIDTG